MKRKSLTLIPKINSQNNYAVILAGGEGSRLKSLTRVISGDDRPKQFCPILQGETLLETTHRRVQMKIDSERILFSLTSKHEHFFQSLRDEVSDRQLVIQPENKGTAPAILYSLFRLNETNPQATVAFFPSDHHISDDSNFMRNVETAFQSVELNPKSIILLGIEPESAETSYGWIEPQKTLFGDFGRTVSKVRRFWEKPSIETAQNLLNRGCLWNSFVMIGRVGMFLKLFQTHLPDFYRLFKSASIHFETPSETSTIRSLYSQIDEINFSSEILEKSTKELSVLRVTDVFWSDWGEPQRVLGTLANLGFQPNWGYTSN